MLRWAITLCLALTGAAQAGETVRQFYVETETPASAIAAGLSVGLPDAVHVLQDDTSLMLAYSGASTPLRLSSYFGATFDQLDPGVLAPGKMVSLNFTATESNGLTALSLVVLARFPGPPPVVPKGAVVVLDGTGTGPCEGQLVLQYPAHREETLAVFTTHLEEAGFHLPDIDEREVSFLSDMPRIAAWAYISNPMATRP